MSLVLVVIAVLGLLTSVALLTAVGLLVYRDRRQLGALTNRLVAEQRIEAATRATLQAMRDAVWRSHR